MRVLLPPPPQAAPGIPLSEGMRYKGSVAFQAFLQPSQGGGGIGHHKLKTNANKVHRMGRWRKVVPHRVQASRTVQTSDSGQTTSPNFWPKNMVIRRRKSTRSWERTSNFGTRENCSDSISRLPSRSPKSPRNCHGQELSCFFKLFGSLKGEELAGFGGGRGEWEKRKTPLYSSSSLPEPTEGLLQGWEIPKLLRRETFDT